MAPTSLTDLNYDVLLLIIAAVKRVQETDLEEYDARETKVRNSLSSNIERKKIADSHLHLSMTCKTLRHFAAPTMFRKLTFSTALQLKEDTFTKLFDIVEQSSTLQECTRYVTTTTHGSKFRCV
jgi:hypothetical protein